MGALPLPGDDAKQLFDRAEPESGSGEPFGTETYDGLKLLAYAYLEDPEAMAVFEAARDRLPKLGEENPVGSLSLLTMAIEALAHLGQRDEAAALYPLTKELVESGSMVLLVPGAPFVEKCVANFVRVARSLVTVRPVTRASTNR